MRGTWLHRQLGDRLFARRNVAARARALCFGVRPWSFLLDDAFAFQMLAAACCLSGAGEYSCGVACTWISNPLTTPFILFSQYHLGSLVLGNCHGRSQRRTCWRCWRTLRCRSWPVGLSPARFSLLGAYPLALAGWDWFGGRSFALAAERSRKKSPAESKILFKFDYLWGHSSTVRAGGS